MIFPQPSKHTIFPYTWTTEPIAKRYGGMIGAHLASFDSIRQ